MKSNQNSVRPGRADSGKRAEILDAATDRFGRDGYEDTKWADIAADVGVGPTALYHYFESKQHCLFVIMDQAIEGFHARFDRARRCASRPPRRTRRRSWSTASASATATSSATASSWPSRGSWPVRVNPRARRQARQAVRERARDLEFAWATFLARAMEQGAIPEGDPRLLTRAILGLYNSVWHWYRPNGAVALDHAGEFYVARILAMVGVAPEMKQPVPLAA